MKTRFTFPFFILLAASLACKTLAALQPTPSPSPSPSLLATQQSQVSTTKTPTSVAFPSAAATTTESPIGEFQFGEIVALDYLRTDWRQDTNALLNQHLPGCSVIAPGGGDFSGNVPETTIAGFTWLVSNDRYILKIGSQIAGEMDVDANQKKTDCMKVAETLFKSIHAVRTYAKTGICTNAPKQRLKIGDSATLRTSTYLRTGPRWGEETRIRLVASATVKIIGGPVCAIYNKGEYSYWQVDLSNGENGWMAEGDLNEYYLAPKK